MRDKLIILSGGMDSTTLLHQFKDEIALAISFDYGSKHNDREFECAKVQCQLLNIPLERVTLNFSLFESNLLQNDKEIPEGHYAEDNMSKTVVPFRNGIMLSYAVGIAESKGLTDVLIANHFGDFAQYPDCRESFIKALRDAVFFGTDGKVQIRAPYTNVTKADIAMIGNKLGVSWEATWSCYKGGEVHCGRCGTCVERIWALKSFEDKTPYADYEYAVKVLKDKGEW